MPPMATDPLHIPLFLWSSCIARLAGERASKSMTTWRRAKGSHEPGPLDNHWPFPQSAGRHRSVNLRMETSTRSGTGHSRSVQRLLDKCCGEIVCTTEAERRADSKGGSDTGRASLCKPRRARRQIYGRGTTVALHTCDASICVSQLACVAGFRTPAAAVARLHRVDLRLRVGSWKLGGTAVRGYHDLGRRPGQPGRAEPPLPKERKKAPLIGRSCMHSGAGSARAAMSAA